jgi:predicted RNase H-like nuclease (RuvC/YqgF family)
MTKRVARETVVSDDNRIVKLESDVHHLQSDVTEIKGDLKSLKTEFLTFKAEVAKEFGSIRTSIERAKLWMVVTGVGTILSVWGAALALARFLRP